MCIGRAAVPGLLAGVLAMFLALPVAAEITGARYADPTTRYPHAVLGDGIEHGALVLERADAPPLRLVLPDTRVFEDTAPRLADVDGDGQAEVVVVESDQRRGARLAIYDATGLRYATPFIGTRFRWLAPAGIADLDGDGRIEIAYVDRPHLAKTLRVWRIEDGALVPVADLPGVTNHRIGERDISGGVRDCGQGAELVLATGNWGDLVAVQLREGQLSARRLGKPTDAAGFDAALACAD
ncbi:MULTISPECIES: FG-GAP repeat domain-containing protein [unclassified Meridianimarinicoccus]|uniref:FG-GAP repeat domain-containing protein n=1 Tax=unclassified Meridianimarinicoccus TaxID=2923344 RepID=UPI001867447C|nr:VCBS repeat-containing protein [Fluviibacterium sp. MJW13]